jgi:hypothetical protein
MCLVAPLAIFLISLGGVGTASATKLCTDSACTAVYPAGTTTHMSIVVGKTMKLKNGSETIATCTEWTTTGTTKSVGPTTIWTSKTTNDYTQCNQETKSVSNGEMGITWTSGSNGTVTDKGTQWTVQIFGVSCTYGTGEGTTLGPITGGTSPIIAVNTTVAKTAGGFLCPSTAGLEAEFVVETPHALFVGS